MLKKHETNGFEKKVLLPKITKLTYVCLRIKLFNFLFSLITYSRLRFHDILELYTIIIIITLGILSNFFKVEICFFCLIVEKTMEYRAE